MENLDESPTKLMKMAHSTYMLGFLDLVWDCYYDYGLLNLTF